MAGRCRQWTIFATSLCAAYAATSLDAAAQTSGGCAQIAALGSTAGVAPTGTPVSLIGGNFPFDDGEIIEITITASAPFTSTDIEVGLNLAGPGFAGGSTTFVGQGAGSTLTQSFVAAAGTYFLNADGNVTLGSMTIAFACTGVVGGGSSQAQLEAQNRSSARAAVAQSAALTLGRTRGVVKGAGRGPSARIGRTRAPNEAPDRAPRRTPDATTPDGRIPGERPDAPDQGATGGIVDPQATASLGAQLFSAGRGAAGQGAGTPMGAWADFTWTGLENDSSVVDSNTDAFTIAGGVDAEIAEGFIVGASLSLGRAFSEAGNDALKTTETSVSISPYFAYRLDERFSVQGLIGYGYGDGRTVRSTDARGEYDAHRYFVALEAALFESWGDFSLYAGVGALWGRSHRLLFTESDGTRNGSARTDIGTANLILQPSYLVALDEGDGLFLEPFATFDYGYDFNITKISGGTNDRDAFRIGAGANLFAGDAISGSVEATRMLGREDQDETSVRATIRIDF